MTRFLYSSLLAAILLCAGPAHATDKITQAAVQEFYKTAAASFKLPYEQYKALSADMMADTFRSSTAVSMVIPGQRPFTAKETTDKKKSIAMSSNTHSAMQGATINYNLKSITISPDGKSARVAETAVINNMRMPGKPVVMNATSACNDTLVLNLAGKLQMATSVCNVRSVLMPKL